MKKLFFLVLLLTLALPSEANGPELVKKADVIQVIRECYQTFAQVDTAILFTAIEDEVAVVQDTACWHWEEEWLIQVRLTQESIAEYIWNEGKLVYDTTWLRTRRKAYEPCDTAGYEAKEK